MEQAFKTNTRTAIATQKVVDYTNMRRTGVVKIVGIGKKRRNVKGEVIDELNVSQKFFQDYRTGIYYGIPTGINELTGEYVWKRIRLYDGKVYNLSDELDAKEWHCVQHWPIVKDSIMDTRGIARFKVEDMDNDAEQFLLDYEVIRKSKDFIMDLSENDLMDFALVFNIDIRNNSKSVVKKMLLEIAERKNSEGKNVMQERINNKKELAIVTAIRRARFCGLITDGVSGLVFKNTVPLGSNEYQAIEFLKGNTPMFNAVETESKNFDKMNKNSVVAPVVTNEAQKLAWLRSKASELGIEKYWMKGAPKLTEEIAEKERLIAEDQLEEATKNPIAKEKKAKAGLSTGEAKAEEAKKSIDEDF